MAVSGMACKWNEEMGFESNFEGVQVPESRMEAGILFQVTGTETKKKCRWKSATRTLPGRTVRGRLLPRQRSILLRTSSSK